MENVTTNQIYKKEITIWLISLTILVQIMIIIGGLTRLTESGLSMVDWRPIMGTIPPLTEESWNQTFSKYKLSPEYKIVNLAMSLNEFKYIFWWEWFHRFFARIIGIVFIIPFIFFLIKKSLPNKLLVYLVFLFILGLIQAVVGWWMVKSGLVDNPYVSSYRLSFHLSIAIIIFSIFLWLSLSMLYNSDKINKVSFINKSFFYIAFILLFITIISGAFMAGTDSGKSFNTYPLMNNKLIPDDYYFVELGLLNSFENTIAINFNHRWLGTLTFIYIVFFIVITLSYNKNKKVKKFLIGVIFFVSLQFLLGVITLIYEVPISLASLHQTNSIFLFASLLVCYHRIMYSKGLSI